MKWNLNKNITIGFIVAFVVLNAVAAFSYYCLKNFRNISEDENLTRRVIAGIDNVSVHIKDNENTEKALIASGDSAHIKLYEDSKKILEAELKDLLFFSKANSRISELQYLVTRKLEFADNVIKISRSDIDQESLSKLMLEEKKIGDRLQSFIYDAKIQEMNLMHQQIAKAERNSGFALFFIFFGNILAVVFLIWALLLLNRDIAKRIRTEIVLNRFIVRAEQAKQREEQFLANMSHEIRTPMNAIIGMTNLILNTPLDPKQNSYLKAIRQSSDNLMVIINEILDFSKINAGKIDFEQVNFNLSDVFYGLYNTFKIKADEKKLKLNPIIDENLPDTIKGDPGKLNQVLINLVGNSLKFTLNGSVDYACRLVEKQGDDLVIEFSVKDTGIGIPEDKLSSIFEDFTQASRDTARKFGGTGLGLSISKKIVELQGGSIHVESQLGKGTTFFFQLAFKVGTQKVERNEKKTNAKELHGLKILLVDDNEFNQVVAVDTLNGLIKNLTIDVAENGKVAIEKMKVNKDYDIVLMDVQMPEMNGYETTKYIRRNPGLGYAEIPIIAMTASATKPEIESCFHSGMTDFVSKPFDANILLIKIATLINKEKKEIQLVENKVKDVFFASSEDTADLSFLRGMTSNNNAQMLKYINMFLDSVPGDWEKLKLLANENNWAEVRVIAHSLKPRVKYMGIKLGSDLIQEIEHLAADEINLELIPDLIAKFDSILNSTYKQLETEKLAL